jgi:hypothetical protein
MYYLIEGIIIIIVVGGAAFFIARKVIRTFRGKRPDCCSGGDEKKPGPARTGKRQKREIS